MQTRNKTQPLTSNQNSSFGSNKQQIHYGTVMKLSLPRPQHPYEIVEDKQKQNLKHIV